MRRPFRRRRILISAFQYQLLGVNLLHFCVIIFVCAAVLFFPLMLKLRSSASPAEKAAVGTIFLFLHARLWPALLLVLGLLALHSVIISHRIAGPLERFQRVLKAVADGDLSSRAKIRKNDYLTKEAERINEMLEVLTKKIASVEAQSAVMRTAFIDLLRARKCGSDEALDKSIAQLGAHLDQLKTCVGQFRTATQVNDRVDDVGERRPW